MWNTRLCRTGTCGSSLLHPFITAVVALIASHAAAYGQLNGTYTVGTGGSYPTIEAAIAALNAKGVSGPTTFLLNEGIYTPPSAGYKLSEVPSMNATNTVTFRPGARGTVKMEASSTTAIFDIDGGDYYILDGCNTPGGRSRDWVITNTSTAGRVVRFINGATWNTVRNMQLMGSHNSTTTGGIVLFSTSSKGGNSNNRVADNTLGDPAGIVRSEVGIAASGSSGANMNDRNIIENNYIINFGQGSGTGYGMYISSYNKNWRVTGNSITLTEVEGITGTKYGLYLANSYNENDTFAYNRIWGLGTSSATTAQYGIRITSQSTFPLVFHHNMISLIAPSGTLYGIYPSSGDPIHIEHNSVFIGGDNPGASSTSGILYNTTANSEFRIYNNVLVNMRTSTGTNTNRIFYNTGNTPVIESNNNLLYVSGRSTTVGMNDGPYYADLAAWQEGTGLDRGSIFANALFVNPSKGNLHIDPAAVYAGEGMARRLGYTVDIDGDPMEPFTADIGADEGNFNGDGLRMIAPNGGEMYSVDYFMDVRFSASRFMKVDLEISADGGATWSPAGTLDAKRGENRVTITTPEIPTTSALVRVVSARNSNERSVSGGTFSLVMPLFTVASLNNNEHLVPADTAVIEWTSEFLLPDMRLALEFSSDGGSVWTPIDTSLASENLPARNSYRWKVPDITTSRGAVRIRLAGGRINDRSNGLFTILPKPEVSILQPEGGERLRAGDIHTIRWASTTTDYVRLAFSSDGGATWTNMMQNGEDIPAYFGRYLWKIPDISSRNMLVSVTNAERPWFGDTLAAPFTIVVPELRMLSPNGGGRYEMGENITVAWSASETGNIGLQFSADNGRSWSTLRQNIDPALGSISIPLPHTPTKLGRIRLSDESRPALADTSDAPLEILPARSLVVYAPAAGERFTMGSSTAISWEAPRAERVMIQYSSNNGANWTAVVPSVAAAQGSHVWAIPNQTTTEGKIRISEVGGTAVAESGVFSIVAQASPSVRLIGPNGGEVYTIGESIPVRWTASGMAGGSVSLHLSSDAGATWTPIGENIPASGGSYAWTVAGIPGEDYQMKVEGAGGIADISDTFFTLRRKPAARIRVVYPNGGERLQTDSIVALRWRAEDVAGDVELSYSLNGGNTWTSLGTVPADTGRFSWRVAHQITDNSLFRVIAADGTAGDTSDSPWAIYQVGPDPIVISSPNGGERWGMGSAQDITWLAPLDVPTVDIHYSADGGGSWQTVVLGLFTDQGSRSYRWTLPNLPAGTTTALVRVRSSYDSSRYDITDAPFSMEMAAGREDITARENGIALPGAFPNPSAGRTEIRWMQQSGSVAELHMYDENGKQVLAAPLGFREKGEARYPLDAGALRSGTYLYEIRTGAGIVRGTLVILR